MNIVRRVAHFALDLNKVQTEALIRLYGRLHFFKLLYAACGLPEAVAARLEEKMIASVSLGLEEQHQVFSRWIKGEDDLADFFEHYKTWFCAYLERCTIVTIEALQPAA